MQRIAFAAAFMAAAFCMESQAQSKVKENAKCTPNPVFEKFPNSVYHSCERSRFSKLKLYQTKDPAKLAGAYEDLEKEGEYW